MALVALAGPVSNLAMASAAGLFFRFGIVDYPFSDPSGFESLLLNEFIWINLFLAFFKVIPVPPLDGYRILSALLPAELAYRLVPIERYGFILLMAVVFLVPGVLTLLVQIPAASVFSLLIS
jgi:Zn-dependent protease